MNTVTAALIMRGEEFLICRRRADQFLPLKWEFAGGKIKDGEEPAAGLRRELREDLDLDAHIGPEVCRFSYAYPGQYPGRDRILLVFFQVTEFRGEPQNRQFAEIRWVPRHKLPKFDFLPADKELVEQIARGGLC